MTEIRFCPTCGAARIEGARYCGSCGADLGSAVTGAATGVPVERPPGPDAAPVVAPAVSLPPSLAPAEPAGAEPTSPEPIGPAPGSAPVPVEQPLEPVGVPAGPTALALRHPRRILAGLLGAAALIVVAAVGAVLVLPRLTGASVGPIASPEPGAVALTSPVPAPPAGLADSSAPAYALGLGFTPDATKVLTVTVLRLSLERYRAATGAYPADLNPLFPAYAPDGADGKPMAAAPTIADGYSYQPVGTGYTLSVVLASGQRYDTTNPTEP